MISKAIEGFDWDKVFLDKSFDELTVPYENCSQYHE